MCNVNWMIFIVDQIVPAYHHYNEPHLRATGNPGTISLIGLEYKNYQSIDIDLKSRNPPITTPMTLMVYQFGSIRVLRDSKAKDGSGGVTYKVKNLEENGDYAMVLVSRQMLSLL